MSAEAQPDTIVAISTPPGRGGIGIVRLSGPEARSIAEPFLKLRHPLAPGHARFAEVLDTEKATLDEAVATYFAAPNSYTSEDVVEIAAHGSPVLLEYLVRQCIANGARLAEPGEFTQRAFLSGRLDLTQAEAVHDLIDSQTLHQARIAAQQLGGALSRRIAPIKESLIKLIAELEAGVDFVEDDLDLLTTPQIATQLNPIQTALTELEQTFSYARIVRDGFTLAIVGRPNAGKSSLFNRLVERDRAIVTASPGTTRDPIVERVAMDGIPVDIIDTAGLRTHGELDEAEALGIAKSREALADADILLLVADATQPLHPEDLNLLNTNTNRNTILVYNKSDLLSPITERPKDEQPDIATNQTSALTGTGVPELRSRIVSLVTAGTSTSETAMITNLRQQQSVTSALQALTRAREATTKNAPHEILLLDLHEALSALDALTGTTTPDDILQHIFSTFCIGK
jgi:tRNA modification GTPase